MFKFKGFGVLTAVLVFGLVACGQIPTAEVAVPVDAPVAAEPNQVVDTPTTTTEPTTTTTQAPATTTTTIEPTTTTTQAPTPTTEAELPKETVELVFTMVLEEWSAAQPYLTVVDLTPSETLIDLAMSACGAFDVGASSEELFMIVIAEMGLDNENGLNDVAYILGAGTEAFCPEHSHLF